MGKKKQAELENHVSGQANNEMLSRPAHALPIIQVVEELNANPEDGLTESEVRSRLEKYGRNELGDAAGVNPGKILIRQVANAMTLVMLTTPPVRERRKG